MKRLSVSRAFRSGRREVPLFMVAVILWAALGTASPSEAQLINPWAGRSTVDGISGGLSQSVGLAYANSGGADTALMTWHPNFKLKDFGIGLDVNLPLSSGRPYDLENVVVRFAEYDTTNWGVRYGVLSGITLGQGLLMDGYTTGYSGGAVLNNSQTAGYARLDLGKYRFEGVGTRGSVIGVHLAEEIYPNLTFGQTYVTDNDGVLIKTPAGATLKIAPQTGYAADLQYPIGGIKLYTEYAKLNNFGGGYAIGAKTGQNFLIVMWQAKAEWRNFDSTFVPAYFGGEYETNPENLAAIPAGGPGIQGYLADLRGSLMGMGEFSATYENYAGGNATLTAQALTDFSDRYFIAVKYVQPNFQSLRSVSFDQGAVLITQVGIMVNSYTQLITSVKKSYDPTLGKVVESTSFEGRLIF